jgi:hypothetical protein
MHVQITICPPLHVLLGTPLGGAVAKVQSYPSINTIVYTGNTYSTASRGHLFVELEFVVTLQSAVVGPVPPVFCARFNPL